MNKNVILCKDCLFYEEPEDDTCVGGCSEIDDIVDPDDYCSRAVPKKITLETVLIVRDLLDECVVDFMLGFEDEELNALYQVTTALGKVKTKEDLKKLCSEIISGLDKEECTRGCGNPACCDGCEHSEERG